MGTVNFDCVVSDCVWSPVFGLQFFGTQDLTLDFHTLICRLFFSIQ